MKYIDKVGIKTHESIARTRSTGVREELNFIKHFVSRMQSRLKIQQRITPIMALQK